MLETWKGAEEIVSSRILHLDLSQKKLEDESHDEMKWSSLIMSQVPFLVF